MTLTRYTLTKIKNLDLMEIACKVNYLPLNPSKLKQHMYSAGKNWYFQIKISHPSQERFKLPIPPPRARTMVKYPWVAQRGRGGGFETLNWSAHYFLYLNTLLLSVCGSDMAFQCLVGHSVYPSSVCLPSSTYQADGTFDRNFLWPGPRSVEWAKQEN